MIKFIHVADLHLDSPFSMLDIQKSEIRRKELRDSFSELIELAEKTQTDLLIISGDLFESDFVTKDTLSLVKKAFEGLTKTKVIIAPGNHDPYSSDGVYKRVKFSDNVYVFASDEMTSFDFPELNCTVYGYAFTSSYKDTSPICGFAPKDPTRINILAAHADTTSLVSRYACVKYSDIERSGFDYIALGHIHNSNGITKAKDTDTYYAYSGAFEGRGFDEIGEKGVISAVIEKADGKLTLDHKFICFSKRLYLKHKLDVTGATGGSSVVSLIEALIAENGYNDRHALEIELEGMLSPSVRIFPQYIKDRIKGLFSLRIIDSTLPLYDTESLKGDPSIKGAFFEKLAPMLESDNKEEREIAALALRYGISALSGGEVSDI